MKRKISEKRIIECYDEIGENLSVISYNRHSMKKVMGARNLNIFEAFREFSLRNTKETLSIIAINLPEEIVKYKEVKEYQLKIEDINFGLKNKKE
jgi:hypothetical protein